MLRILLAKDLRRAWRNPLPWIINLIVPLAMTALLGLVFGGGSENGALGRIRFAVVNEDKPVLSDFLRSAANQNQGGKYLDPVFIGRDEALRLVNANKISAVLIIETNFLRNYLTAREPVTLTLIKNPAEAIHPAVLEELTSTVVTALNAISRNFIADFPAWKRVFEGKEDYQRVSFLINQAGNKLKTTGQFIDPPLVGYEKEQPVPERGTNQVATAKNAKGGNSANDSLSGLFAYLLIGLSAMFLLFLGQNGMTDLHRELRLRTFERYQTLHQEVWPFILSKVVFTVVMLLICSGVMLGGGGLVFQIHWQNPVALSALVAGYSCFVAALFGVLVALVPDERRAGVLNNIAGMALGLVGGCAFPPQQLPAFLREHVTPLMPSYWFADAARKVQSGAGQIPWGEVLFKLLLCAAILIALAAWLFRRKLKTGLRA
jgi:ABC-2 type transport system permease protein